MRNVTPMLLRKLNDMSVTAPNEYLGTGENLMVFAFREGLLERAGPYPDETAV
jgi:hypothetical protein